MEGRGIRSAKCRGKYSGGGGSMWQKTETMYGLFDDTVSDLRSTVLGLFIGMIDIV